MIFLYAILPTSCEEDVTLLLHCCYKVKLVKIKELMYWVNRYCFPALQLSERCPIKIKLRESDTYTYFIIYIDML